MNLFKSASLIMLCGLLPLSSRTLAVDTADAVDARVDAVWYADSSCRLSVDGEEIIGVTSILADMGEDGARTMVHCDGKNGLRITLMALGDGLALGERVVLADPADIETAVNGSAAWLSRPIPDVPSDQLERRFVIDGRIMIHETPIVDSTDSTLHADKLPFAEIHGWLEPLPRHPGGAVEAPLSLPLELDESGDAQDLNATPTKLACLVRPCGN